MPNTQTYRDRRNKGLCPACGRKQDQQPYTLCSVCYTHRELLEIKAATGQRRPQREER